MLSRQRAWQIRMKAEGRCSTCGKPLATKNLCEEHRRANTERVKRTYRKRRAAGACVWAGCKLRPRNGRAYCAKHAAWFKEYMKTYVRPPRKKRGYVSTSYILPGLERKAQ